MRKCAVFFAMALLVFGPALSANAQTTLSMTRDVTGLDENGWLIEGTTTLDFTVTLEAMGDTSEITALAVREVIPPGWTFNALGDATSAPQLGPLAGEAGPLQFAWFAIPQAWPVSFTYTVNLPENEAGPVDIAGRILYRLDGPEQVSADAENTIQAEPTEISVARSLDGTAGAAGQFYVPGTTITVNITLTKEGPQTVTALAFLDETPAGWTFQGAGGANPPDDTPNVGDEGPLQFIWTSIPDFPVSFSFDLAIPADDTGAAQLNGSATYRLAGGDIQSDPSLVDLTDQPCIGITRTTVPAGSYTAGQNLEVTVQINNTCAEAITALAVREFIPAGWAFVSAGGPNTPQLPPTPGAEGTLNFAWFQIPASPVTFTYLVSVPADQEGDVEISGRALYRLAGPEQQSELIVTPLLGDSAPVITLNGLAEMLVECGDVFVDPGAVAMDVPDGDISEDIVVTGAVDANTPGVYELVYNVTDSTGNPAVPVVRTVTVQDTTAPVITLNGEAIVTVECNDVYVDAGAVAVDACEGDVAVIVGGDVVDTTTPGDYIITYNAVDGAENAAVEVFRTVSVQDTTAPVITVIGEVNTVVECKDVYVDAGAVAIDACEGEVEVVVTGADTVDTTAPGEFTITYSAEDSLGNADQVVRNVSVVDTTGPEIELLGNDPLVLECNTPYVEPGWVVTDACDPNPDIVVTGWMEIDITVDGESTVTYTATDASGNVTVVTRTVIVQNCITCEIDSVAVMSPLEGQSFLVQLDGDREIPLSADVVLDGECDEEVVMLTYTIDGVDIVGGDAASGFAASVLLPAGEYTVTATAWLAGTEDAVQSDPVNFIVRAGIDADADGFLDNPFADLLLDGDSWVATVQVGDCPRTIVMTTWFGGVEGDDPIMVTIPRADLPDQVLNVSVPRGLLVPGEQAVLIVAFACDLPSLLGAEEAALLAADPGSLVDGAAPFDVSIIVTNDGGATFYDLDNVLLEGMPIELSLNGLEFNRRLSASFYAHPSFIDSSEETSGIKLYVDDEGDWALDDIQNKTTVGDTLAAETTSLSVFHSYEVNPIGPTLSVKPSSAYPVILGIQELNKSITKTITLTNIGGGTLAGTAVLADSEGAFSIVSGASYSLAEGQSAQLVVRFTPKSAQAYEASLSFGGAVNSPVVLTLKGTGTEIKLYTLLGCAPGGVSGGGWAGDLLVLTLALSGLMLARRYYRRAHQR
jgi:hypothetical protein